MQDAQEKDRHAAGDPEGVEPATLPDGVQAAHV